jgi:hypothetical protein
MERKSMSVAVGLIALLTASPRSSAQDAPDHSASASQAASDPVKGKRPPVPASQLPMEDLHDVGYILQLIRQQAVDIYAEATRRKTASDSAIEPLDVIPNQPLLGESDYKPLRKAWIAFFIGTMEPLVHLLDEGWRDVSSGTVKLKVPAVKRSVLDRMMAEIGDSLTAINKHLNKCADVLDTTDSVNLIIAHEAAGIAAEVSKAEQVRTRTFKIFGNVGAPGTYEMRSKQ